jgi:hypothetical protein
MKYIVVDNFTNQRLKRNNFWDKNR